MSTVVDGNLRSMFRTKIPGHWQSVETGSTGQGVPDSNYCVDRFEGWVEFKQTHGWSVRFKTGQVAWLMRRARAGGRGWVAIRRWPEGIDELWLVPGGYAEILAQSGLRQVQLVSRVWTGGPRKWDWTEIRRHLTSEVIQAP